MSGKKRGGSVNLPLRITLTEDGSDFFLRKRKNLSRFQLADGSDVYGLVLETAPVSSLQRMLLQNYISRIEISRTEFLDRRQQVIDFSKMVTYGILYRNFDSLIFSRLLQSDLIRQWNRHNPANIIDDRTRINETFLATVLEQNRSLIEEVRKEISMPLIEAINNNGSLLPEEKNVQILSCEYFLQRMRPLIWFILSRYHESAEYSLLVDDIRINLGQYLEKAKTAEYLALLILELLTGAENTNLKARALGKKNGKELAAKVLYSESLRAGLFREMEAAGEQIHLDWRLRTLRGSTAGDRLEVTLYNRYSEYRDLKEKINSIKGLDMREKSLSAFCSDQLDSGSTELGIYYISYLQESCEKVGIRFESNVHQVRGGDVTIITLQLQF